MPCPQIDGASASTDNAFRGSVHIPMPFEIDSADVQSIFGSYLYR